jgi:hypothetical protein
MFLMAQIQTSRKNSMVALTHFAARIVGKRRKSIRTLLIIGAMAATGVGLNGCTSAGEPSTTVTYSDFGTAVLCQRQFLQKSAWYNVFSSGTTCLLKSDVLDELNKTDAINTALLMDHSEELLGGIVTTSSNRGVEYRGSLRSCFPPGKATPTLTPASPKYGDVVAARVELTPLAFLRIEAVTAGVKPLFSEVKKVVAEIKVKDMVDVVLDPAQIQSAVQNQKYDLNTQCRAILQTTGFLVDHALAISKIAYKFYGPNGFIPLSEDSLRRYFDLDQSFQSSRTIYSFDDAGRLVRESPTYVAIVSSEFFSGSPSEVPLPDLRAQIKVYCAYSPTCVKK